MSAKHTIPFLERQSYRRRRLIDTIRMLPVLSCVLWAVPLLWLRGEEGGETTPSGAIVYIFLVWAGLVVCGAFMAWSLKRSDAEETERGR